VLGGASTFENAGTFRKSAGAGTTTVSIPFNNTGTVDVQAGILALDGGTSSGNFNAAAGRASSTSRRAPTP
jgi:hypothetical protein